MDNDILSEQINYYRARAPEYDASLRSITTFGQIDQVLLSLGHFEQVLELACGTGIWTKKLVAISHQLTALDAAPEMLAINQQAVTAPNIRYIQADLFEWEPDRQYDLVFFAFWLSHIPPEHVEPFFAKVKQALNPGGRLFIVDEPLGTHNVIPTQGITQARTLADGRIFSIVKVYHDLQALSQRLGQIGFDNINGGRDDFFFYLTGLSQSA